MTKHRPSPFQAVVFDLDGTLVDSERLAMEAGLRASRRIGVDVSDTFFHSLIGLDFHASQSVLTAEFGADVLSQLNELWDEEYRGLKASDLELKADVSHVLDGLAGLGLPRAVATSSRRSSAMVSLTAVGLHDHFDTVVTRDCVDNAKPHPEPYLTAASRLGVAPEACLAFEDSATGARSALAAGMTVVVVPDIVAVDDDLGHHRAESLLDGARKAGLLS